VKSSDPKAAAALAGSEKKPGRTTTRQNSATASASVRL
jgi:hypothetical protein